MHWSARSENVRSCRLVLAYNQSAATLNLLRGFSSGGYASLDRVANWDLEFMDKSKESKMYLDLAHRVQEALMFMKACGLDTDIPHIKETEFYTGHECLLLEYEQVGETRSGQGSRGRCVGFDEGG